MATNTQPTPPAGSAEYRTFAAWTHDEFRNLLCGLPPVPPKDAPARTRQQIADDYVRDELRRVAADRHVRDAILAGHLKTLDPPDDRLLEKITPHVTSEELEALRRAVVHERSCSKAYRFAPDAASRWGASHTDWFPDFPFPADALRPPSGDTRPPNAVVTEQLKDRRNTLIKQALRERGVKNKTEFCRTHKELGITPDILRGVVNGDSSRVQVAHWTPMILNLLGIGEAAWTTA
jgi:hypothetical protein